MIVRNLLLVTFLAATKGHEPCSVCGDGKVVSAPEADFSIPSYEPKKCSELQFDGQTGNITPDDCKILPSFIDVCVCIDGSLPPIEAPTTAPVATGTTIPLAPSISTAPVSTGTTPPVSTSTSPPVSAVSSAPVATGTTAPVSTSTTAPVATGTTAPVITITAVPVVAPILASLAPVEPVATPGDTSHMPFPDSASATPVSEPASDGGMKSMGSTHDRKKATKRDKKEKNVDEKESSKIQKGGNKGEKNKRV